MSDEIENNPYSSEDDIYKALKLSNYSMTHIEIE